MIELHVVHRYMYIMGNKSLYLSVSTASVVVSCKIPILATRVRFPGSARFFFST